MLPPLLAPRPPPQLVSLQARLLRELLELLEQAVLLPALVQLVSLRHQLLLVQQERLEQAVSLLKVAFLSALARVEVHLVEVEVPLRQQDLRHFPRMLLYLHLLNQQCLPLARPQVHLPRRLSRRRARCR